MVRIPPQHPFVRRTTILIGRPRIREIQANSQTSRIPSDPYDGTERGRLDVSHRVSKRGGVQRQHGRLWEQRQTLSATFLSGTRVVSRSSVRSGEVRERVTSSGEGLFTVTPIDRT